MSAERWSSNAGSEGTWLGRCGLHYGAGGAGSGTLVSQENAS